MTSPTGRPKRADAVRNLGKIVASAQEQISTRGADASMADIARGAGVAVGTLYRHFPTKADLVAAVLAGYVRDIADDIEEALERTREGASPMQELAGFLARVAESTARNHAVKAAAAGMELQDAWDDAAEQRSVAAMTELLERARAAHELEPSIDVSDTYLLISTVPVGQSLAARRRWLAIVMRALAADPGPLQAASADQTHC